MLQLNQPALCPLSCVLLCVFRDNRSAKTVAETTSCPLFSALPYIITSLSLVYSSSKHLSTLTNFSKHSLADWLKYGGCEAGSQITPCKVAHLSGGPAQEVPNNKEVFVCITLAPHAHTQWLGPDCRTDWRLPMNTGGAGRASLGPIRAELRYD
ncbi:Hypothetical predicted protein [Xyrichtys novacula]|uniref:Uncharacterized protein n=1 Tax=Xyrichtys novacula TaxID=13765 RepID=A0AAV1EUE8_XYRNO|nr:Hypothetical predicted protein [Xyrichtys novacula]